MCNFFIVINKIKLYQEPEIDDQGKYIKKPLDEEQKKKKLDEDLKEGVLKINCGVPIVFVINKADVRGHNCIYFSKSKFKCEYFI